MLSKHPSPPSGGDSTGSSMEDAVGASGSVEVSAEAVARLESEVEAVRSEKDEWCDRYLRIAAEFDNFRKRTEREKMEVSISAKSALLVELLPVLDAFERAMQSFSEARQSGFGIEQYQEGVELLYKQFNDILSRIGVVPIDANGRVFDPHLHEAVMRVESEDHDRDVVVDELRRGYLFKDRLLRPAQVRVAIPLRSPEKDRSDTLASRPEDGP